MLLVVLLLQACVTTPRDRLSARAAQLGLQESEMDSAQFRHLVFRNYTEQQATSMHVYLEGDGRPWIMRFFHSNDPTPRQPLMLSLMAMDRTPSVYLGRPCYNEQTRSKNCTPAHWTSGRYSAQVVNSMASILATEVERSGVSEVSLFGHSGGGALALLLAEKIPQVVRIVTLAGNLDTDAWIEHHGYSRLYTSLNPAKRAALSQRVEQFHFMGARDANIPPALVLGWIQSQSNAYGIIFDSFTHGCCWMDIWDEVLAILDIGAPYRFPGRVVKHTSPAAPRRPHLA